MIKLKGVNMCELCNDESNICIIFYNDVDKKYYLRFMTTAWNDYNDKILYINEEISYCPYCGRKLDDKRRK